MIDFITLEKTKFETRKALCKKFSWIFRLIKKAAKSGNNHIIISSSKFKSGNEKLKARIFFIKEKFNATFDITNNLIIEW